MDSYLSHRSLRLNPSDAAISGSRVFFQLYQDTIDVSIDLIHLYMAM